MNENWIPMHEKTPAEGKPLLIMLADGEGNPDLRTADIAYYCDGTFFKLELDPHLGVLRKQCVNGKVTHWAKYIIPYFAR